MIKSVGGARECSSARFKNPLRCRFERTASADVINHLVGYDLEAR
jgi:hypothetical protein